MTESRQSLSRQSQIREPDVVLGLCDECRRPSFIDTAPPSLADAVAQAALYDRMPKVLPKSEALRIWHAGVCDCRKGRIVREREEADQRGPYV